MPATCPKVRCVRCTHCGARRYNRCRRADGRLVDWHHSDRYSLAEVPKVPGRPRMTAIPDGVLAAIAAGTPLREVERRFGVARTTLKRHGVVPVRSA